MGVPCNFALLAGVVGRFSFPLGHLRFPDTSSKEGYSLPFVAAMVCASKVEQFRFKRNDLGYGLVHQDSKTLHVTEQAILIGGLTSNEDPPTFALCTSRSY